MLIETQFVADNARIILHELQSNDYSMQELARRTGINYYSVRKAMVYLKEQGLVKNVPGQLRNAKFTIVKEIEGNDVMPYLDTSTGKHKLIELLGIYRNQNPNAAQAVLRLPMYVAKILTQAQRLKDGKTTTLGSEIIRKDMEKDFIFLKNAAELYEQILKSPRIWDDEFLKRFPEDHAFDPELLQEVHNYYFKEDDDA